MSFVAVMVGAGVGQAVMVGAGIGAAVGQVTGGNTKSTLTGAGIGALGGLGYSAFAGAGAASGSGSLSGAGLSTMEGVSTLGVGTGVDGGSALGGLFSSGSVFSNPLLLGSAGLGLASAFSSQGTSFQDKIKLSPRGEQLEKNLASATKTQMAKAKAGDVQDKAFTDISNIKKAEALRHEMTQKGIGGAMATLGNVDKEDRGVGTVGGTMAKSLLVDAGERMEGLFAPTSILNNYRREELFNAARGAQRLHNIDQQTASFEYGSQLSKWQTNQMLSSQRGAALGGIAQMFGGAALNQAYLGRINAANQMA